MLNVDFLGKLTADMHSLINQMPGYFLWKDMNFVYLAGCLKTAKLFGFKHTDALIGITDYDIRCKAAEYADKFHKQDTKAMQATKPISILTIYPYANNEVKILLVNKSILRDVNHLPLAISCYCVELNYPCLNDIATILTHYDRGSGSNIKSAKVGNYYLSQKYSDLGLSVRQSQCLFYFIRGKSARTIATILNLSHRTVESYLNEIKDKMYCGTKSEVIEQAIDRGYAEIIPEGIMTGQLPKILAAFNKNFVNIKQ